jgi:putative ABC transport system substrate-binding protein
MWGAGAVKIGLAKSFARPGLNVTGLETQNEELTAKHMELLKTMAPRVSRLGVLNSGNYLFHDEAWHAARESAHALRLSLVDVRIGGAEDLPRLAASCGKGGCDGLYVMPGPVLINLRAEVIEQAARLRLPAVYFQPEFVEEGGLASYSPNIEDMCRRAAGYVDKILKGAKPADLPIERPLKFELLINLKTAKSLGLTIPGDLLARADRIIS